MGIKETGHKLAEFHLKLAETSDEAVILCMVAQIRQDCNEAILLAEACADSAKRRLEYLSKITPDMVYKHFEEREEGNA